VSVELPVVGELSYTLVVELAIAGLLALGVIVILSTRSLLKMLLGVEVLFNAALLYLVLVGTLLPMLSSIYAIFAVALASAEVIVAVSIAVLYYRAVGHVEARGPVEEIRE